MKQKILWVVVVLFGLAALLCAVLGAVIAYGWPDQQGTADLLINLGTEAVGALVIFVLIERLVTGAERETELKAQFIGMMGSTDNEIALRGAAELQARGWISDGSLVGQDFQYAKLDSVVLKPSSLGRRGLQAPNLRGVNLSFAHLNKSVLLGGACLESAKLKKASLQGALLHDANLREADLREAILWEADLQGADLGGADLQEANLGSADLKGANLERANLKGADLDGTDLREAILKEADLLWADLKEANLQEANLGSANLLWADLGSANLYGADLRGANLQGAILRATEFDESTFLPDYTKWTPDIDMARFTSPQHPDFWCPEDPDSPAYVGDEDE